MRGEGLIRGVTEMLRKRRAYLQGAYTRGGGGFNAEKYCMICLCFKSLSFSNFQNGLNFNHFAKIAHKIEQSKYFFDI